MQRFFIQGVVFSLQRFSKYFKSIDHIPTLNEFMNQQHTIPNSCVSQVNIEKSYFIETYGCQMNENDSMLISSILQNAGYSKVNDQALANIILLNTCAIRANAENRIYTRLSMLQPLRKEKENLVIGLLGCMAERLKSSLWGAGVDVIVGPDSYRRLPELIENSRQEKQIDVQLSWDETYEDFMPIVEEGTKTTYVSIMRGCNNMCSFCIVPFTRGRERSRSPQSILQEVKALEAKGLQEITLLGQNVNSYFYSSEGQPNDHQNTDGFDELYKLRDGNGIRFHQLLQMVAQAIPNMRIRFTSPHPKNFPDQVLQVIASYPNISKSLHIPIQSGSTTMLSRMRRNYTKEALINLTEKARAVIPGVALTTDVIVGFCDETEEEFQETLEVMKQVKFEQAFMFAYSMREKTHAHRNYQDNIPSDVKQKRLENLIETVHRQQIFQNEKDLGRLHLVLIDTLGKKPNQLKGRTDTNKSVIIDQCSIPEYNDKLILILEQSKDNSLPLKEEILKVSQQNDHIQMGDFVVVKIVRTSLKTLFGIPLFKSTIQQFATLTQSAPYVLL